MRTNGLDILLTNWSWVRVPVLVLSQLGCLSQLRPEVNASLNTDPHRVAAEVAGARGVAALEFPDRAGEVEAGFVERTASTLADQKRLVALGAFALPPFVDKAGIFPVARAAFGKREAAGGVFKCVHAFK